MTQADNEPAGHRGADAWSEAEEVSPAAYFEKHCALGELVYQVGMHGEAVFPPRLAAPGSGTPLRWAVSAGTGTVYATTVVRRRGAKAANVALVDLDEGFRMMSRVEDVEPEQVAIGMRVRVRFDGPLPCFVPAP